MKIKFITLIFFVMGFFGVAQAAFNIEPGTNDDLTQILKGLADDHAYRNWCQKDCGQIYTMSLSGKISDGTLNVSIMGNIVGKDNGVLPLFGAVPAVEVTTLKQGESEIPLIFYNKAYYTLLPPGPFHLTGQIKIDRSAATNVTLPGSVGQVKLDITDQEPLLGNVPLGIVNGSFQIVSAAKIKKDEKDSGKTKQGVRLEIERRFRIARDKSFEYMIHVMGAEVGQVIAVPLEHGEKVLEVTPSNAKTSEDKVDFTATASENDFWIEGEWTQPEVKVTAADGAVNETWVVICEGAYDCEFAGDVEKDVGTTEHKWLPLSGQTLVTTWKELTLLKGQSIVAQTAVLDTQKKGDGYKQTLSLKLTSSAADHVLVTLPELAIPTSLQYDGVNTPILKNDKGQIHLTVPQGDSKVGLNWEISEKKGSRIPLPSVQVPIGKWVFWYSPGEKQNAIYAGGLSGSPVVLFWPRLGLCLFLALLFLYAEKRLSGQTATHGFFLILAGGYALHEPLAFLIIIAFMTLWRFLSRVNRQRTVFGWIFEGGILAGLLVMTLGTYVDILDAAFFTAQPFRFENFCAESEPINGLHKAYEALCWETDLVNPYQKAVSPYVWVLPTLAVRGIYFIWALLAGYFFYMEFQRLGQGLKNYVKLGVKPILKKVQPQEKTL